MVFLESTVKHDDSLLSISQNQVEEVKNNQNILESTCKRGM